MQDNKQKVKKPSRAKAKVIMELLREKSNVASPFKGRSHYSGKTYRHD